MPSFLHNLPARFSYAATAYVAAACLIGCKTQTVDLEPAVELPERFSQMGSEAVQIQWWEAFNSPELNEHIATALRSNLSLEAAWLRLQAAEALTRQQTAQQSPTLDATAGLQARETDNSDGTISGSLGAAARYELDLWGRLEAQTEVERLSALSVFENAQTLALSLSAEVALTWLSQVEAQQRAELLKEQLSINENIEEVLLARFSSGQIDSADVLRQRQLIEATRQQLFNTEAQIQFSQNRMQVLKGQAPAVSATPATLDLPSLPDLPQTGIPNEVIERRPDVRSAYFDLMAEDAQLAASIANQYPRFNLSGSVSSSATSPSRLFEEWTTSLLGQLTAPLFDGGSRKAQVERREALMREKVLTYGQTLLDASLEIENALIAEKAQSQVYESLERELALNQQTYGQLRTQYLNGATGYLSVLTNLRDGQQLQRDLLASEADLLSNRVALYRALAQGLPTDA